jgi:excisionase family DNA binding protein
MAIRTPRAPRFLTPDDIADHLQVSVKTVRRWIGSGDLAVHVVGRQHRIAVEDFEVFVARTRKKGTGGQ